MGFLVFLPTSVSLSYYWNIGSFMGISLLVQVITGIFLYLNYSSVISYDAIQYIMFEVEYGWLIKIIHSNNASLIFSLMYLHLFKNIGIMGYRLVLVWLSGVVMMLLIIGAAFTGYALVGSQMSFWAVMVITSLLGVVPFVGENLLFFFWGGYILNWTTFQVLSVIQFVLPFMVVFIIVLQLLSLHLSGSTDLIGAQFDMEKVGFYPYFWCKDIVNLFIYFLIVFFMLVSPYSLGEPELFEESNPISSPLHIIPEWYFLPQYAILRCVPSKGLGVILILISVVTFLFYPFTYKFYSYTVARLSLVYSELLLVWFFWLGVIGSTPIAQPYMLTTQLIVFIYFMLQLLFFVSIFDVNYGFSLSDILWKFFFLLLWFILEAWFGILLPFFRIVHWFCLIVHKIGIVIFFTLVFCFYLNIFVQVVNFIVSFHGFNNVC